MEVLVLGHAAVVDAAVAAVASAIALTVRFFFIQRIRWLKLNNIQIGFHHEKANTDTHINNTRAERPSPLLAVRGTLLDVREVFVSRRPQ